MSTSHSVTDALAAVQRQTEWYADHGTIVNGLSTGIDLVDETTWGLRPGTLSVVMGEASSGKTSFALSAATWMVRTDHRRVLWVSLQEDLGQVARNLVARCAHIDEARLRTGALTPSDRQRQAEAVAAFAGCPPLDPQVQPPLVALDPVPEPLRIMADQDLSLAAFEEAARAMPDLDLVVVDGLARLVDNHGGNGMPRATRDVVQFLEGLARAVDVHVLATLHVDTPWGRQDQRPRLADLREHRTILPTAHVVMALFREELHHEDTARKGILEVDFLRNGSGRTRKVDTAFLPAMRMVANLVKDPAASGPRRH